MRAASAGKSDTISLRIRSKATHHQCGTIHGVIVPPCRLRQRGCPRPARGPVPAYCSWQTDRAPPPAGAAAVWRSPAGCCGRAAVRPAGRASKRARRRNGRRPQAVLPSRLACGKRRPAPFPVRQPPSADRAAGIPADAACRRAASTCPPSPAPAPAPDRSPVRPAARYRRPSRPADAQAVGRRERQPSQTAHPAHRHIRHKRPHGRRRPRPQDTTPTDARRPVPATSARPAPATAGAPCPAPCAAKARPPARRPQRPAVRLRPGTPRRRIRSSSSYAQPSGCPLPCQAHFPFETLCLSNHTDCRLAGKHSHPARFGPDDTVPPPRALSFSKAKRINVAYSLLPHTHLISILYRIRRK